MIEPVPSRRLLLDPLTVSAASEMVPVLGDPQLYEYTGGQAPTLPQLRDRYHVQVVGQSTDGAQWWLNWVIRWQRSSEPAGYVQATVEDHHGTRVAEVAWVVSVAHQGQGVATEAAEAMIGWLRSSGVHEVVAHIHPSHDASIAVAERLGLRRTDTWQDSELRWARSMLPATVPGSAQERP